MSLAFDFGFGVFLLLMAVLVVFVLRFAIRMGRRRPPDTGADPEAGPVTRPGS